MAALSGPDPTLYLYTSLTAGSSHIITATSRLETILKANKIAFRAIDCATDEKARNLWSRKSKGRRLPGLVKHGLVIGDLKEVEEWNEYGEIDEKIEDVSDLYGDTPMTDTPMPPPEPITLKDPLSKVYDQPRRSTSQNRHISISDPKDSSPHSSTRSSRDETPMNAAMRQAGAEAAAIAGQRKANASTTLKSSSGSSAVAATRDPTENTPTATATKKPIEAEDPAEATEVTAAKTPAQLATEGAMKTSVEKVSDPKSDSKISSAMETTSKSTEEQLLEAKRESAVTNQPSRLQQGTSIDEVKSPVSGEAVTSDTNLPGSITSRTDARPSQHRGSSLGEASKEEIKAAEDAIAIKEVPEEGDASSSKLGEAMSKSTIQATDEAEIEVMKGSKPQDQKPKDADAAGVSAAAMFLSPNHNPNLDHLSAESASVYSFFDTSFNPAPLFSGVRNLDLGSNFMKASQKPDPRSSIGTYASRYDDDVEEDTHQVAQQATSQGSPPRDSLPTMPVIAPLRTQGRRLVSEPLASNRVSTPSSAPLPLNIRKSPAESTRITTPSPPEPNPAQTFHPLRSQPPLQTDFLPNLSPTLRSPASTTNLNTSPTPSPATSTPQSKPSTPTAEPSSRGLRFKKSVLSLRSKKSSQRLNSSSPTDPLPPNLPAQRNLKDLGAVGIRSVSESYASKERKHGRERERGKLLCF